LILDTNCLTNSLRVENSPYIPLTIERHNEALHFIHWLEDSYGDLFIDAEMVFDLAPTGRLTLREVATQDPIRGGEVRSCDRSFAQLFSRNLLDQGFAAAARQIGAIQTPQPVEVSPEASTHFVESVPDQSRLQYGDGNTVRLEPEELNAISSAFSVYPSGTLLQERLVEILEPAVGRRNVELAVQTVIENYQRSLEPNSAIREAPPQNPEQVDDAQTIDRTDLEPVAITYLDVKDQHPNDLVLQRCASGDFYTAHFDDAATIATALDLTLTSRDAGGTVGRIPSIAVPAWSGTMERFTTYLESQGYSVFVDPGIHPPDTIAAHPEVLLDAQPSHVNQSPEPEQPSQIVAETNTLFDVGDDTEADRDDQVDVQGHDPTWESDPHVTPPSVEIPTPAERDSETPTVMEQATHSASPVQSRSNISHTIDIAALANEVRNFDLEDVAASLGLQKDRHDKHKWKDAGHTLSINDGKFMDWLADKGGGGAIDLVMYVRQVEFKVAVQWLSGQTLTAPARSSQSASVQKESRSLELPARNSEHWATVRHYLVETRGLPATWIDRFYDTGLIYADDYCNVVFLRYSNQHHDQPWSRHAATGASLRGTRDADHAFHGLAPGSARENGWFWLRSATGEVNRVVLTESPIDAISLAVLEKEKSPNSTSVSIYLSTDGSGAIPTTALQTILDQGGQVIAAFDADKPGEKMAWRIAEILPGITRMTPAQGKDWNDRLLIEHHPDPVKSKNHERGDQQTLRSLWKWHRVAGELGRAANCLRRITEVARAFVEGEPLSDRAVSAMQQDFQTHKQQTHTNSPTHPYRPASEHAQAQTTQPKKSCQGVEIG
jgi:hypothetical protein